MAMGRAPMAKTSRTIPPTPVAAPWYGSMAEGWLCDSIFIATHQPPPMSMTPAFSSPPFVRPRGLVVGKGRGRGHEGRGGSRTAPTRYSVPSQRTQLRLHRERRVLVAQQVRVGVH